MHLRAIFILAARAIFPIEMHALSLSFWRDNEIRRTAAEPIGLRRGRFGPDEGRFLQPLFFSTMIFLSQGLIEFLYEAKHRYYVILDAMLVCTCAHCSW